MKVKKSRLRNRYWRRELLNCCEPSAAESEGSVEPEHSKKKGGIRDECRLLGLDEDDFAVSFFGLQDQLGSHFLLVDAQVVDRQRSA